jgi:hypothetical protein
MSLRIEIAALLVALLSLGLMACGGGGGSTSSTATTTTTSPTSTGESGPKSGSVTFGKAEPRETAANRAERRRAGRAAAFVLPRSDNSVPTFGSEAGASERRAAEANLWAYLTARAAHNWAKACALLSATVREGYERLASASANSGAKPSCARILPTLAPIRAGMAANPLTEDLVSLRVHGANAFALFYGPGHQQYMVPMNREAGQWRPTQAAPIAYPPGAPSTTSP